MRGHWILAFVLTAMLAAPAHADDQSQANQLFVEAAKMANQAEGEESASDRANLYAMAAARLNSIIQLYPASDVAAALVAQGHYGRIDLDMIAAQATIARLEVQLAARSDDPASADAMIEIDTLKAENAQLKAELGSAMPAASFSGDDAVQELVDRNTWLDAKTVSLAAVIAALTSENAELRDAGAIPAASAGSGTMASSASMAEIAALKAENARLAKALAYEEEQYTSLILAQTDVGGAAAPAAEATPAAQVAAVPAAAPEPDATLTGEDIMAGVRDALRVGTENVVGQLGAADGFNADPKVHIPLPDSMKEVTGALKTIGLGAMVDDLELKINRAAEDATPAAKELFWQAITDMSIDDIEGIFNGPDDAATQYFKGAMSNPLGEAMRPIIDKSLAEVGAVQAFDDVMGKYKAIPFVPNVKADLTDHTLAAAMEGIFYYLAEEEAAIRNDAVKRTTELLQRVFADH